MDKAQDWSIRIAHEASLSPNNCFLTLTYSDEHLPDDYSVSLREHQLFIKRLRKEVEPTKIRFFMCGEYGEKSYRPHYHYIIFGFDFADKILWRKSLNHYLYRSPLLEKVWPYGHAEIGTVTASSGGYVARYCLKKISGAPAGSHYQRVNPLTGELVDVSPEFACMSKRPGLGSGWFCQYEGDAFPSDFVIIDGKKKPIPRFYAKKLTGRFLLPSSDEGSPFAKDDLHLIRNKRRRRARDQRENNTPARLAVREESAHLRAKTLTRTLEDD